MKCEFAKVYCVAQNMRLVIWIESGRALLKMPCILEAADILHRTQQFLPLHACVFGSDDFCADIGCVDAFFIILR